MNSALHVIGYLWILFWLASSWDGHETESRKTRISELVPPDSTYRPKASITTVLRGNNVDGSASFYVFVGRSYTKTGQNNSQHWLTKLLMSSRIIYSIAELTLAQPTYMNFMTVHFHLRPHHGLQSWCFSCFKDHWLSLLRATSHTLHFKGITSTIRTAAINGITCHLKNI